MLNVPPENAGKFLDLCLITNLKTKEDMERRVEEFILFHSRLNAAVSLMHLNRRFGKTAKKLGWPALTDIVKIKTDAGLLGITVKVNKLYLYDAKLLAREMEETREAVERSGQGFDEEQARRSYLKLMIENSGD